MSCSYTTDEIYDNPWIYNGEVFTSGDIGDYFGFVYLIAHKS